MPDRIAERAKPAPRPRIGAHCAGGVGSAVQRAIQIGAECVQVFASAPQTWRPPSLKDADVTAFTVGCAQNALAPVYLHGIYLMNLASVRDDIYRRSIGAAIDHLRAADRLGAAGLIIHMGSAMSSTYADAERRVVEGLAEVIEKADAGSARLVLETCAGQGNTIGRTPAEIGAILRQLAAGDRLAVCLDTCHVFAAGFDITKAPERARLLDQFEEHIGLSKLLVVHANDSKGALGSNVDRHDNIGFGQLGEETFAALLAEPALANVPFVLEVPGLSGEGPDEANMAVMRRLRGDLT